MKNLNIEQFKKDVDNFTVPQDDAYIKSYPHFVNYFQTRWSITEEDFVIGSHFTYGWMPTIVTLDTSDMDKTLTLLNKVKDKDYQLSYEELSFLKSKINNSVVGLSKLLHFINPNIYAIYDSRIYMYVRESKTESGIGRPERYLLYMELVNEIIEHEDFDDLYLQINKLFDYHISKMRAVEIVLFETGKNKT